ncbi:hypothetical protein HDU79_000843 [Rhizoclosmatium sp. JEL0117]|nr:hypothetical protein HDU79_000843 [Rhizoclosmatium sp. JEL0117]
MARVSGFSKSGKSGSIKSEGLVVVGHKTATGSNTENQNNAAGNVEIELDKNGDVVMEVEYAEPVVPGANFKDPAKWQRVGHGGKIASGEKHPRSYASAAKVSKKSAPVAPVLSKNATFAEKKAFKKSKETKEKAALSYAEQAKLIAEQRVRSESIKAGETIPETQQPPCERITYSSFVMATPLLKP